MCFAIRKWEVGLRVGLQPCPRPGTQSDGKGSAMGIPCSSPFYFPLSRILVVFLGGGRLVPLRRRNSLHVISLTTCNKCLHYNNCFLPKENILRAPTEFLRFGACSRCLRECVRDP